MTMDLASDVLYCGTTLASGVLYHGYFASGVTVVLFPLKFEF